jgi:tripartite ATP-independent transporter DctM subunit
MTALIPYIFLMLIFLFGGLWVAAALGLTGAIAIFFSTDLVRLFHIVGTQFWSVNTTFTFIALPLFLFMGEIMSESGIISLIYNRVSVIFRGLPGGLLHSNIFACCIFAACSGSSMASAAAIGSIGYPLQKEQKYDKMISLGSIAAGGTLGILIPPSIPMIIYAVLAEESLGKIYLGGVIPGIILSCFFSIYILIRSIKTVSCAPSHIEKVTLRQRLKAMVDLWEIILIIVAVLGGIYGSSWRHNGYYLRFLFS